MANGTVVAGLVALGVVGGTTFILHTPVQAAGSGTLVVASPSPTPSPYENPLGTVDVSSIKLNCTPKYIGAMPMPELAKQGINGPDSLAVEMTVFDKPLMLHNLTVQLYSTKQVIWQSDVECGACLQNYAVSDPQQGGYFFRLDATGVGMATQLWPQATAVGLAGMAHDGATARFSFVRADTPAMKKK